MNNKNKEKIVFTLPEGILSEVDKIIQMENSNREDFAKAAFQFYITQKKKLNLKETMIKGYKEMGRINLSLAELGMTDEISLENDSKGDMAKVEYLNSEIRRGDLYYADLSPVVGSEQGGVRPVLVIQNNIGNKYSPTIIIAAITSQINKAKLPTHIEISANEYGLNKDSVILLEQIRTIDKKRLREKIGCLDKNMMLKIDNSLQISLGLFNM